jgi:predicted tellurium resistance membrane protein TerC
MLDLLADPNAWASLLTLTLLEIVLGIDNVVFLSIVSQRLPREEARKARRAGLAMALAMRIALLASIAWIIGLTAPLFEVLGQAVSWRDIVLMAGGLFLLVKGTQEIHNTVEGTGESAHAPGAARVSMTVVIMQIAVLDLIFSIDSVITAVGMAEHIEIMIAAVVISIVVMAVAAEPLSAFISHHPTVKMLALGFLLLVGMALVADGLHFHIPRGYVYFAIAFSMMVEALNLMARRNRARGTGKGD